MKVTFEMVDEQIDALIVEVLTEQLELCIGDHWDGLDKKESKKMIKALKQVLRYNTPASEYAKIMARLGMDDD